MIRRMVARVGWAGMFALALVAPASAEGETPEQMGAEVLRLLQESRVAAGVRGLEDRDALTRVARRRAELVAALPHAQRLSVKSPIAQEAVDAGSGPYLRLKTHLDLSRGARDPASAFFRNWQRYEAWSTALDPDFDAVGLGIARGADGWTVLVVILFQDMPVPTDLPELERATVARVNAVRRARGLSELVERDWLSDVARHHSQDMARRDYVGHKTPEGHRPADRVRAAGRGYRKLGENIYMGSGMRDPARVAVDAWMDSRGHRKTIETPGFVETGLGIAVDERGRVFFTQLFYAAD